MIKELAHSVRASESYLARVMLWLVKSGILSSIRGKRGGFSFKLNPSQITIADVVMAIDDDAADFVCQKEARGCQQACGCMLLSLFDEAQQEMLNVLRRKTIADIAEQSASEVNRAWLASNYQDADQPVLHG